MRACCWGLQPCPPCLPCHIPIHPTLSAAAAPAPKRRKLSSDAVFGIRVGTDQLDRLWNLTEDNTSGEDLVVGWAPGQRGWGPDQYERVPCQHSRQTTAGLARRGQLSEWVCPHFCAALNWRRPRRLQNSPPSHCPLPAPCPCPLSAPVPHAALSADDRGGFKSVRQLMEPVIEEMQEAAEAVAAGAEDDGLMLTAVGRLIRPRTWAENDAGNLNRSGARCCARASSLTHGGGGREELMLTACTTCYAPPAAAAACSPAASCTAGRLCGRWHAPTCRHLPR